MRSLLVVGPFYANCDFAPSPAMRLGAYGRYLPEFGWRPLVVAPACRCTLEVAGPDELIFDPHRDADIALVAERLAEPGDDPIVLRPVLRPTGSMALWTKLASSDENAVGELRSKMSWHLTPRAERAAGRAPSPGGGVLLRTAVASYVRANGHQAARARMLGEVAGFIARSGARVDVALGSHGYAPEVRAAAVAATTRSVPLIVEMRDALWRTSKRAYKTVELVRIARTVRRADGVIYVTPQEPEHDAWWLRRRLDEIHIVEHGFEESEWETIRSSVRPDGRGFVVRFLGSLYPGHHLEAFLRGFVRFLKDNGPARDDVRFEYFGPSTAAMEDLVEKVVPEEYRSAIAVLGPVPRHRAQELMASSDVLALPMSRGVPGGRFYEYLGSGRRIIAAGDEIDPYVADALARTDAGHVSVTETETARLLAAAFAERSSDDVARPRDGGLDHFSRRRQARDLAEVADRLTR